MFMLNNGGAVANSVPDICKVPTPAGPVPTPFVNIATSQMADAGGLVRNVLVSNMPAVNQMTRILRSNGDEPGTVGGMMSNQFGAQLQFLNGSFKVMVGGKPAVRVGSMTGQNGLPQNAVGAVLSPSQVKVMVMS